jgi:hypothetical protein
MRERELPRRARRRTIVAGAAWCTALVGAFAMATELGTPGRQGAFTGALFSMLALAAAARIGMVIGDVPAKAPALLTLLPFVAWTLAAAMVAAAAIRRTARA